MQGVEVAGVDPLCVIVVQDLTDELRRHIMAHLSAICYGDQLVVEDAGFYSFTRTVREFLTRFDSKPEKTQLGMVGELLIHVVAPMAYGDMMVASIYLNKEERSIKKGFDLTFATSDWSAVWYAEVKSGRIGDGTAEAKVKKLLRTAAKDLTEKLDAANRRSLWDTAILDAGVTLSAPDAKTVKDILRDDAIAVEAGAPWQKHGLVAAALFHPIGSACISHDGLADVVDGLDPDKRFASLRVIAVQKSTLEKVIQFLRDSAGQ